MIEIQYFNDLLYKDQVPFNIIMKNYDEGSFNFNGYLFFAILNHIMDNIFNDYY
jgi:hypothetical protein